MKSLFILLFICLMLTKPYAQTNPPSIEWKKNYGGTKGDTCISIRQSNDGGYIVAGISYSKDFDVSGKNTSSGLPTSDYWILKISETGDIEWQKSLGGIKLS